jgi:two-component system chemotaxis response regulator CheB
VTVVQDPSDALFDGMPRAALRYARVDHIVPADQMGVLLGRLARKPAPDEKGNQGGRSMDEIDAENPPQILRDIVAQAHDKRNGETTIFTCPECGGTLWQLDSGGAPRFNCHVGHTYSPEMLLEQMSEELEAALWACVRMLVEKATLTRQLAQRLRAEGQTTQAARIEDQAKLDDRHGQVIRDTLLDAPVIPPVQMLTVSPTPGDGGRARRA